MLIICELPLIFFNFFLAICVPNIQFPPVVQTSNQAQNTTPPLEVSVYLGCSMLLNIFSNIVTMKKVSFVKYLIKQKTQRNVNIAISQECRKCEQSLNVTHVCLAKVEIPATGTES